MPRPEAGPTKSLKNLFGFMIFRSTTPATPQNLRGLTYHDVRRLHENGESIRQANSQDVRSCQIEGKRYVFKCYHPNGPLFAFRVLTRTSRSHRSLRMAYFMGSKGVPYPAHFLVIARWNLWSARSYLLIEHVGGLKLHDYLYSEKPGKLLDETAQAAIDTIKSLHSLGLSHGDLHTQNLIVANESTVQLIDLDNVKKTCRRQQKDIARFKKSVANGNQNADSLLKKIAEQLKA